MLLLPTRHSSVGQNKFSFIILQGESNFFCIKFPSLSPWVCWGRISSCEAFGKGESLFWLLGRISSWEEGGMKTNVEQPINQFLPIFSLCWILIRCFIFYFSFIPWLKVFRIRIRFLLVSRIRIRFMKRILKQKISTKIIRKYYTFFLQKY